MVVPTPGRDDLLFIPLPEIGWSGTPHLGAAFSPMTRPFFVPPKLLSGAGVRGALGPGLWARQRPGPLLEPRPLLLPRSLLPFQGYAWNLFGEGELAVRRKEGAPRAVFVFHLDQCESANRVKCKSYETAAGAV